MPNPLYNKFKNTNTIDATAFKTALAKQGPDFLQKMEQLAKQKGISQKDIDAGLNLLRSL